MDVENAKYDDSVTARIVGKSGLFAGEETLVRLGQCVVVGRSRMCDLSVARTSECMRLGKEALEQHRSYRKISRKHLRICLVDSDRLEVEDLSTNGTAVDGYRVDKVSVPGLRSRKPVIVEFGDGELLEVTIGTARPKGQTSESHTHHGVDSVHFDDVPSGYDRTPVP